LAEKVKKRVSVAPFAGILLGIGVAPDMIDAASFSCKEAQRHSFAVESSMTPAYPGRTIDFTINGVKSLQMVCSFIPLMRSHISLIRVESFHFGPMQQMWIVKTSFCF